MSFNLRPLGLVLVLTLALSFSAAPSSSAEVTTAGVFTAEVGVDEFARIDGEQLGVNTLSIVGQGGSPVTCTETPMRGKLLSEGKSSTKATLKPEFTGCHTVVLFVTRTITVTVNGCAYVFDAKTTDGVEYTADVAIECPDKKQIEIHIYNTSNFSDAGASVLCTFDVQHQEQLQAVELTNKAAAINDIVAHLDLGITVTATITSGTCGNESHTTATLEGEATIRATDEEENFVDAEMSG